jgi:predicted AlkP superfamily phosphohydrolase/phosphomutase
VWLLEEGYIAIRQGLAPQLRFLLWKRGWSYGTLLRVILKLLKWLPFTLAGRPPTASLKFLRQGSNPFFFSTNDVDWLRTKAYCRIGVGGIDINLRGRGKNPVLSQVEGGVVESGQEYESLKQEIAGKLRNLQDPETGEEIGGSVYIREHTFHGEYIDGAPDIVFLPMDSGYIAGNVMGFTTHRAISANLVWPGNHRMDGILLARGKPMRVGQPLQGASIMDLAPTILYLMGIAIPSDMDGRVLEEIFLPEYVDRHPIAYRETAPPPEKTCEVENEEEMEEVVRRLKELGYLT